MKQNFEHALSLADRHKELPFPPEEFAARLSRAREAMSAAGIDLLFVTAPESLYYLSGFQGEWYQAQSGRAFPPTSGIAVHVDHDSYIHFETPSEAMLTAIGTVSEDVRIFPLDARRDGLPFILGELRAEGWLKGPRGARTLQLPPEPLDFRTLPRRLRECRLHHHRRNRHSARSAPHQVAAGDGGPGGSGTHRRHRHGRRHRRDLPGRHGTGKCSAR